MTNNRKSKLCYNQPNIQENGASNHMKKILFMMTVLCGILLLNSPASIASVKTEKGVYVIDDAEGYAYIKDGKKSAAREEAKRMAYRDAIEKALGACVSGIDKIEGYNTTREKIFSKTSGLVKNFKITNEAVSGDMLTITGTCQVSEKSHDGVLGPEVISMLGNPRVMILVDERVGKDAPFVSTVEGELLRIFEKAGYLIVDPDQAKMLLSLDPEKAFNDPSLLAGAARTLRADIIILGRAVAGAFAHQKIHGISLYGVSGTVQLKAVLTQTAYQISSRTISGGTGKKPVQTVGGGATRIFRSAVSQAAEDIVYKIAYSMASAGSSLGGITVNIKLAGASFKDVEEIEERLREFAGTGGELFERSYLNGLLEVDLVSGKTARNVASFISDYANVEGVTSQTVTARMLKAGPVQPTEEKVEAANKVINIHIDNVKRFEDSAPIERALSDFVGKHGDVVGKYEDTALNLTVTYPAEAENVKTAHEIASFLKTIDIRADSVQDDSITAWKQGGWLW